MAFIIFETGDTSVGLTTFPRNLADVFICIHSITPAKKFVKGYGKVFRI
jgi:hypothetical protein